MLIGWQVPEQHSWWPLIPSKKNSKHMQPPLPLPIAVHPPASQAVPSPEQQITVLLELTRVMTEADDLHSALYGTLRPLAKAGGWCYGDVWLPHDTGDLLRRVATWHEDAPGLHDFAVSSDALQFTPGVGLVGKVWQSRRAEWIADIGAVDPSNALQPERAQRAGLRSSLLLPVIVKDRVLALLVFFAREVRPQDEALLTLITLVTAQLGAAIHHLQGRRVMQAREGLLRSVTDSALDAIVAADSTGKIIAWNLAAEQMYGYPAAEVLGQPLDMIIPPCYHHGYGRTSGRFPDTRQSRSLGHTVELPALRRDGTEFPSEISLAAWSSAEGDCLTAIIRDTTERRRSEEELRTLNGKLEARVAERTALYLQANETLVKSEQALRKAEEQLRQANDDLEQRVAARTLELASANERLLQESAEREQAERQLRASEERFRQIAEHVSEVFYIFDLTTQQVLYVSPSYERIWGQSRERLYADARSFVEPIHHEDRLAVVESLQRQAGGASTEEIYRLIQPDGSTRWVRDRAFPVHNQHGDLYRVAGLAEDITEQRAAEGLLLQANEELERLLVFAQSAQASAEESRRDITDILSQAAEGFIALDRDWRFRYVNTQAAALIGRTPDAVIGKHIWETVPMLVQRPFYGACQQAIETGSVVRAEEYVEGREQWYECRVYPSEKGISVFFQDVTERKQTEAMLRHVNESLERRVVERTAALSEANSELERAARLKDEFLANMSHELRTPLNAVLTLTEAVTEGVYGSLNERQAQALNAVSESGQHLLALINDILDLTKIESGKVELDLELVDVEEICAASLRMVRQLAHTKRLRIVSTIDPIVDGVVADPRRLKQILVNLLSNAVKFTPEGGSVSLEILGEPAAEVLHLTVADTGIGIETDDIPRLFKPFVQLDSRLSRRHEGTGLGLALVACLAELHGGGVSVTSAPAQGSRFTVSLPWRSNPEQPAPATVTGQCVAGPQPGELPVVLLAEDNKLVLQATADYLVANGYVIRTARNGAEAVTLAQEILPDVILMDIQMPMMDGLEATRLLRAEAATRHTPIIALTALAMTGDRERCLAAGVNDYLSKPVSLNQLVALIEGLRRPG